jgi:DNA repair exonuclease SbcCD ATPase subunit
MGIAFLVAAVAAVLAVVFWFQGQSAANAVKGLRESAESARKEAEESRAELKKAEVELKSRGSQLQEAREKLNETRKKIQEGRPKQLPRGAREAELEEDLAHARKLTEDAHAAEAAARKDLVASRASEQQLKGELATAQNRVRELSSRPAPAVVETAPAQPQLTAELEASRKQLDAARAELERQVQQADRNSREAKKREVELREEIRKHKGRAETNNRVYLVTKGELELTKERLAAAERKLWQAGIPLTPTPVKERPKATGPASADRPREAEAVSEAAAPPSASVDVPTGEAATAGAASAEIAEGTAPAVGEPISEGEEEGVAPIRRRPSENGAPNGAADKTHT